MNVNQFHNLEHALGTRFLEYVLNYRGELVRRNHLEEYGFTGQQLAAGDQLLSLLAMSYAATPGSALLSYPNLIAEFNRIRQQLGGLQPIATPSSDPLLNYLLRKAVECYAILLLKEDDRGMATWGRSGFSMIPSSLAEANEVAALLRDDSVLKTLLRGEGEVLMMRVEYALDNSLRVSSSPLNFCGDFLHGAFAVCCYRGRYALSDFLKEVGSGLEVLRSIAAGTSVQAFYFRGLYGIRLDSIEVHYLGDDITLRNIDDLANPVTQGTMSTGATEERSGILLGCVLEHAQPATRVLIDDSASNWTTSWAHFEKLADDLVMSVVLGGRHKRAPVGKTFTDIYVPLYRHIPSVRENVRGGITCLDEPEMESVTRWFNLLRAVDAERVRIPLQRIQAALYERTNPVDALLDFFIAWESMFSSDVDTRQSIARSLEAVLVGSQVTVDRRRLKRLYDLRSAIVHGGSGRIHEKELSTPDEAERTLEEVGGIALAALSALLRNHSLLALSPRERVELLLKPQIWKCSTEGCEQRHFRFPD